MPETLMVCDCHINRAFFVQEDGPLSFRELYVPLHGPDFGLSLFQPLEFGAQHIHLTSMGVQICPLGIAS